ncbi:MAG TPA: winged helix-turn-helix transcriptional regulator [Nitrososphaerales archaeon]|nr:winged helix-turn-helix transcriptional regulator [Nitrososphaerales archaeon]
MGPVARLRRPHFLRQWSRDNPPFSSPPDAESVDSLDATQRRILDFITSHPGAHLRDICRALGLAMGVVQYHVQRLERDRRIHSMRRGLYKFFYPANLFGERQRDVLSMLSLDRPRELLLNIIEHPGSTQEALAGATKVSQPTVSWHLKRLVDLGIVGGRQNGRVVTYSVTGGVEIATFIRTYHPTVWERWSSRLADIFISYSAEEGKE